MKRLRYAIEGLALRIGIALLSLLPVDAASNFGGFLGRHIGPRLPVSARRTTTFSPSSGRSA